MLAIFTLSNPTANDQRKRNKEMHIFLTKEHILLLIIKNMRNNEPISSFILVWKEGEKMKLLTKIKTMLMKR